MRLNGNPAHPWLGLLLYVGSMLLIFEWITPLEQVTDTGHVYIFFIFVAYCYLLTVVNMSAVLRPILKMLGLLFVIHYLFYEGSFLSIEWIGAFLGNIGENIRMFTTAEWMFLSAPFRTLLFLVLLWMLSYLLYYWFVIAKRPLSFILFTFIYLTVLDTFTGFDATWAIVRAFIIGVAILGSSHLYKMAEAKQIKLSSLRMLMKWVAPLLLVIFVGASIGYAAPKHGPQWPDPVPFLQGTAEDSFGGTGLGSQPQRIGYGENDEQLGGGFVADDTVVFVASAPSSDYWKVETKDEYTGKGWVRSIEGEVVSAEAGDELALDAYDLQVERTFEEAEVQLIEPGNLTKLPYRYGIAGFPDASVDYNPFTGEVKGQAAQGTERYELAIERPSFPIRAMREAENLDMAVSEAYLQLPDELPSRVRHLAEEITEGLDDPYDKVRAIESYFTEQGYAYETQDVPLPEEDEDFVDQFLFDTQRGYCDHYSTAMVVMLRSIDIPARWAKGFTGGEVNQEVELFEETDHETYEIQNNNAHSWVEVYFPEVGWVPFEPTVGFSNTSDFVSGRSIDEILEDRPDYEPEIPEQTPEIDDGTQEEQEENEEEEDEVGGATGFTWSNFFKWLLPIGVLALIVWLIYRYRFKWLAYYRRRKLQNASDPSTFNSAYVFLLKVLKHEGFQIKEGQTLREFAGEVDRFFGNGDMSVLTRYYERAVYGKEDLSGESRKIDGLWDKIIRNLMS